MSACEAITIPIVEEFIPFYEEINDVERLYIPGTVKVLKLYRYLWKIPLRFPSYLSVSCNIYATYLLQVQLQFNFFKKMNDTYGHQSGDLVLKAISEKATSMIRSADLLARNGGEEFVVVMPQTETLGAVTIAERLREAIEEFIDKANKALYDAKTSGRNKVVTAVAG